MSVYNSINMDPSWTIIDRYFSQGGGMENANPLVQHQIESFNEFVDKKLSQIIQGFNAIQICHNYKESVKDFSYKIYINILNPTLSKPIFQQQDGSQIMMTPHVARMNSLTYAVNMYADIQIITETINDDNITERKETKVPNVNIGKLPIMVRSKACILNQVPGIAENSNREECRYDPGGYFIVNGNEKVVISQDRISENKTVVFSANGCLTDGLTAEIRSAPDGVFLPPKTTSLTLSAKPNHMGRTIRLNTSFLRSEVPLFVMFRALGVETDRLILKHILFNLEDMKYRRMMNELTATVDDASDIYTQEQALNFLMRYVVMSGTPKEYLEKPEEARKILLEIIQRDFLPHVGRSFRRKALYLGYMIRKLLRIYLGYQQPDNRDSYLFKRIDTPGVLMSNLFRQCWGKMIKEMRTSIQRELQLWRASPTIPATMINASNIHRFIKQSIIEMGIRYALSTGNWGVKTLGSFQNIRTGVAQVLNRMSYLSTLSHLRRINTPMEKNGKLVQPRKLENSQFGMICPAETPEGGSVGLVKNIALSTRITTSMSSLYIRKCMDTMGIHVYDEKVKDIESYLYEMGDDKSVHISFNGDIMGYHREPVKFYETLKNYKRRGQIPPTTCICWDVPNNIITVNTEAGRMCRPLYIVDKMPDGTKKLRIERMLEEDPSLMKRLSQMSFMDYVAFLDKNEEGFIEYLDVEEFDKAMVAMTPADIKKTGKMTYVPPNYTHCEIHPSLMLGVLACNIPFSDHNQSPRNCYQCLWEEEPVLMEDGSKKKIKDVKVGDKVITFNPDTMNTEVTTVIHQYVKPTDKTIVKVTTYSGRKIITTNDHKYMTNKGWLAPKDFDNDTKVGILVINRYSTDNKKEEPIDISKYTIILEEYHNDKKYIWDAIVKEYICAISSPYLKDVNMYKWLEMIEVKEDTLFMPVTIEEIENCMIADITVESENHCFFGGDNFAVHNSAMGKQAVGIYMSNYNQRIDTLGHVLNYPQKPMARTRLSKYTNSDNLPSGTNAVVAIMTKTGYNQEDSVMVNKSALDRGLFTSTYYKAYRDQCSKNHSTGEEEVFVKPLPTTSHIKPYNYDKLDDKGFIPKNVYVDDGDIIVGKVMPHKIQGQIFPRDASMVMKTNDHGHVDMTYQGVNGEGYKFCKIRLRKYRKPTIGDKLSSRHGQKGTIGMIYNQEDMPFSKDGITPDIIVNPHAIPSRMTVGQLIECIMGKAGCFLGAHGDATPFTDCSVEKIADVLESFGMERYGNEVLYNGRTGEMIHTEIFMGPTFYQRLKHMVSDKAHCLTMDHEVLTEKGWKLFHELEEEDKVATLQDGHLVYEKPIEKHYYPNYQGKMYHISNSAIDLDVTEEHRMWVSSFNQKSKVWNDYKLELSKDIEGKYRRYRKDAVWDVSDYQFILPAMNTDRQEFQDWVVPMKSWLTFFGIWMAEGYVYKDSSDYYRIEIAANKKRVKEALNNIENEMGIKFTKSKQSTQKDDEMNRYCLAHQQIAHYLYTYSVGASNKYLPLWVWNMSANQCQTLIHGMMLGDGSWTKSGTQVYYTSSNKLADDFQQLCLHAGWCANKKPHIMAGTTTIIRGKEVTTKHDSYRITVIKKYAKPSVNHGHVKKQGYQREMMYDYEGPVFCLSVSSEVFMVRRNGKAVWTGNSRGSNGPVVKYCHSEYRKMLASLRYGRQHDQIAGITCLKSIVPRAA